VDEIPASFSLDHPWMKMVKHSWATKEGTVVKQWVLLLKHIVEQKGDWRMPVGKTWLEIIQVQDWPKTNDSQPSISGL
jgi:hypothetical protein